MYLRGIENPLWQEGSKECGHSINRIKNTKFIRYGKYFFKGNRVYGHYKELSFLFEGFVKCRVVSLGCGDCNCFGSIVFALVTGP